MNVRIPSATYRLQLNRGFTFAQAAEIIEYLNELGISDCYISPLAQARAGSLHCYDVTNHGVVNPEIGGEDAFREFVRQARQFNLGIVVDTVPNHMCISDPANRWWFDVLENGPSSPYATYFDIDWHPPKADLANKVLLPVLGDQYGHVLENREFTVFHKDGAFFVSYSDLVLPLAPRTWTVILEPALLSLGGEPAEPSHDAMELESVITALNHLPLRTETDAAKIRERRREKEIIKERLAALTRVSAAARSAIEASVQDLNGVRGEPRSFNRLEKLLDDQAYRLSFWQVAADEINYRRFFDVNDLAAIRVEQPEVFRATHELTFRLIREGLITGLRIDHVDGLRDPGQYLGLLHSECAAALAGPEAKVPPLNHAIATEDPPMRALPFYVVVEKILGRDEPLRAYWAVHGTTGYEFLNDLNGLYVDRTNRAHFEGLYALFTGDRRDFGDIVYDCKKLVLRATMSGEQNVLARKLDRISEQHRWSRDFTLNSLGRSLAEVIACFPVYRSYVTSAGSVTTEDRRRIMTAISLAKRRNPALSESTFDFLASVLLLAYPAGLDDVARQERLDFTLRFQQLTSPVMAKGFEDTALYRFVPLASLNEVGSDPTSFGTSAQEYHDRNQRRLREWPHGLSPTSTHDSKRGEDVRARINVLSEIPEAWGQAVLRWHELNARARVESEEVPIPDANEEYLFYQTLVGAWPLVPMTPSEYETFVKRIQDYMLKAAKEAKLRTSWISPNHRHDHGLAEFVRLVLEARSTNGFVADFVSFRQPVAMAGMLNSLSQTLLKICSPGVPDLYQGTELWDDNLIDPDNRRPVDFAVRRAMLEEISRDAEAEPFALLKKLLARPCDGRVKMYVTRCALQFRRKHHALFATGAYLPLQASGERARNVISFARRSGSQQVIIAAGRFFMSLGVTANSFPDRDQWANTTLAMPPDFACERYTNLFTDCKVDSRLRNGARHVPMDELFAHMPVAMLVPIM
ncbi:MAG: malto-oligosyltrehalose synthase [Candidatus Binataceae bacterium]